MFGKITNFVLYWP